MKKLIIAAAMLASFAAHANANSNRSLEHKFNTFASCADIAGNAALTDNQNDANRFSDAEDKFASAAFKIFLSDRINDTAEKQEINSVQFALKYSNHANLVESKIDATLGDDYSTENVAKLAKKMFVEANCQFALESIED